MKLKLVSGEDVYWIVGNPDASPRLLDSDALTERISTGRNQQVIAGAGWEMVDVEDRCNQRLAWDMQCRRKFADEWERLAFIARMMPEDVANQEHPWIGELWLRIDRGDWAWSERKITKGILSLVGLDYSGECGLLLTYRVQAGGIGDTTRSGVSDYILDSTGQPVWGSDGFYIKSSEHED